MSPTSETTTMANHQQQQQQQQHNHQMDASGCNIIAMNAKAIQLVQQNEDRNAIKLFLQALSSLKSELKTCHKHADSTSPEAGAFLRVPMMMQMQRTTADESSSSSSSLLFGKLLGLCTNVDPCAPEVRDGATALLLYNAGVTEHHMALFQDTTQPQRQLHLKKAAQIYNMAFSAAQHWKRYTIVHPGYSILCCAILNNLIVSSCTRSSSDKMDQLKMCLKDTLATAKDTMTEEEKAFFASNLDKFQNSSSSSSSGISKTSAAWSTTTSSTDSSNNSVDESCSSSSSANAIGA